MDFDLLSDEDYDRISRYVTGEAGASERAEIEEWIHADPARRSALESIRMAWSASSAPQRWDVDAAWGKFSARLDASATPGAAGPTVVPIERARVRRWWSGGGALVRVAAAAAIVAGVALVWPALRGGFGENGTGGAAVIALSTAPGERQTVELLDGSTVVLGVASSLRTLEGYGEPNREVVLSGEAFFTVTHDEARPFRVHVGDRVVEDLGTEFAVRFYEGEAGMRVAVASGSVALRRGTTQTPEVVLSPRQVAMMHDTGAIAVTRDIDVERFTAFSTGRLVFSDSPFADVVAELQRWYGVTVRITDSTLLGRHLTATFDVEPLDEVLRIIGMTLDVRYVRNGQVVEFTGTGGGTGAVQPRVSRTETGA